VSTSNSLVCNSVHCFILQTNPTSICRTRIRSPFPRFIILKKPQPTISPYSRRVSSPTAIIMLRRKPTSITLTTEDVAIYEDSRARENHLREQAVLQAQMQAQGTPQKKNQNIRDPNDELRPLPGDRARAQHVKTRDERLGLMGGGGGSSRA
jgi:hypothetical protein